MLMMKKGFQFSYNQTLHNLQIRKREAETKETTNAIHLAKVRYKTIPLQKETKNKLIKPEINNKKQILNPNFWYKTQLPQMNKENLFLLMINSVNQYMYKVQIMA